MRKEPKTLEEAYDLIINQARTIFLQKQNDYGSDNISALGIQGVFVRMWDKINRLKRLVWESRENKVKDESIDDTFLDILNYAIIALLLKNDWWKLAERERK